MIEGVNSMKFATKCVCKKGFKWGDYATVETGEVFYVANYEHKYHVWLYHNSITELLCISPKGGNSVEEELKINFDIIETVIIEVSK